MRVSSFRHLSTLPTPQTAQSGHFRPLPSPIPTPDLTYQGVHEARYALQEQGFQLLQGQGLHVPLPGGIVVEAVYDLEEGVLHRCVWHDCWAQQGVGRSAEQRGGTGSVKSVGRGQVPICRHPEQDGLFLLPTSALLPTFPRCVRKGGSSCSDWPHVNLTFLPDLRLSPYTGTEGLLGPEGSPFFLITKKQTSKRCFEARHYFCCFQ